MPGSCTLPRPGARAVRAASLAALLALSCQSRSETTVAPAASASTAPAPSTSASAKAKPTKRQGWMMTGGPKLAILAGKGVGTIRIGATVATIERHMDRKCEVLTEQVCRYVARAVDFELERGVVRAVRVHRPKRPSGLKGADGQERVFGVFNGMIPPDVQFGMHIPGVQISLGKPTRVEQVSDERFGTRELHHYPGMILEYDQLPGAPLVLGGVRVIRR